MDDEGMRILIVDDEKDIGRIISKLFLKRGIHCEVAYNIRGAMNMIEDDHYDIYILDIHLPDGTGFDLIPRIRNNNNDPKVVMISAFDGEDEKNKASRLEVDQFISKPFSKEDILEILD